MSSLLDLAEIELLAVLLDPPASGARIGEWPCPACGERRDLVDSVLVRVRNRSAPPLEREILLCELCVAALVAAERGAGALDGARAMGEPWLTELEDITAVRTTLRQLAQPRAVDECGNANEKRGNADEERGNPAPA